jgi:PhnB protein
LKLIADVTRLVIERKGEMHVPEGFAQVTPYIFANDAERYIHFLKAAFGAQEIGRSTAANGGIANCQMRFGDMTILISSASEEFPASRTALYFYVEDANAIMRAAAQAGAQKIMDVADMYGDRQGGVRDPSGNIWWVSQRLTAEPYF